MDLTGMAIFAGGRFLYGLLPGPNNAAIVARTLAGDTRGAAVFAAGLVAGNLVLAGAVLAGVAIWIESTPWLIVAAKWGAALFLGATALRMFAAARHVAAGRTEAQVAGGGALGSRAPLLVVTGFAASIANPQLIVFYALTLPGALNTASVTVAAFGQVALATVLALVLLFGVVMAVTLQARRVAAAPHHRLALDGGAAILMAIAALWMAFG